MIRARPAVVDDADALAAAHIEGWRVGYRDLLPDEFLDAPEFAAERLDRWRRWVWCEWSPQSQMFAVEVDGRVVGMGHAGPARTVAECDQSHPNGTSFSTTTGEVYGFYVHPDAWGSGAATELMRTCEAFLRAAGFADAVLWVLRDNPRARAFYEKAGWTASGRDALWEGPSTGSRIPSPLVEVEYRTRLR